METILATAFGRVIDIQQGEADELTKASASISELAREGADTVDLILVLLSEFCEKVILFELCTYPRHH